VVRVWHRPAVCRCGENLLRINGLSMPSRRRALLGSHLSSECQRYAVPRQELNCARTTRGNQAVDAGGLPVRQHIAAVQTPETASDGIRQREPWRFRHLSLVIGQGTDRLDTEGSTPRDHRRSSHSR